VPGKSLECQYLTDDLEDFTQWRGSVEERLGTLESKVETEAHLRATMDSDMGKLHAEFRAQRSMLQALHDTQQDHTARLTKVEDRLVKVEDRLGNVEGTLQLVRVGIEALTGKIDTLIERD
jgi:chromosome segregation ATPase